MVLTMQSSMMILELVTAGYLNQNRLTWHSILGRITNYYNISLFVGGVFIIHVRISYNWSLIVDRSKNCSFCTTTTVSGVQLDLFLPFVWSSYFGKRTAI